MKCEIKDISYAQRLLEHTAGKEDLFTNPHVKEIATFPAMAYLDGNATVSFSDSSRTGRVGLGTVSILRSHYGDRIPPFSPRYYMTNDRCGRWNLHLDSIVYDLVWKVQVTEQIHNNHQCVKETVYLIDFISEQAQERFAAEFVCSMGQENL